MDRRNLMAGGAALALTALSQASRAADDPHAHHHGHGTAAGAAVHAALVKSAADCVVTGQACLAHCLVLLADGDKAMAACAQSVNQMLAMCGALQSLAGQTSKYTPALAKVVLDVCVDCEKECKKHADKHAECKACAQACAECIKACKTVST
ncbi:MAG: four-helix bundle copper-binding protein [Leptothrix sp. (in: Bacteria)]|jgi:Cys-rich four helix bundle protein (predicted Tat secretion target)|nr:four-helix bundle copper-binding protein [Leptothrix sp. (in: b-proteobacteria)]HQY08136.1 four-helix bundle copper-binding protein [Burkholderiaceae bacterium]